jgi:DNA-binding CsgD family transcriptional regulator
VKEIEVAESAIDAPTNRTNIDRRQRPAGHASPASRLTRREQQVLELTALGLSVADVADELQLSEKTIRRHLASGRRKSRVRSLAEDDGSPSELEDGVRRDRRHDSLRGAVLPARHPGQTMREHLPATRVHASDDALGRQRIAAVASLTSAYGAFWLIVLVLH